MIAVAGKNREITRDDVRRAIDAAKAVSLPTGREILHVLPQDFVVDEQDGIGAPVGMTGARLEVNVHIVTGSQSSTQNIVACVNRAGVDVADTVIEQLAASEVGADRRREGARRRAGRHRRRHHRHRDLRARQPVAHRASIGVGGDHFTNDIAVGLRTPIPDAEKIKRKCGCALSSMVDEDETMEVASVGGRKPRVMARRILSEILQPRAEEIFHLVWDEIRRAGYEKCAQLRHRAHRRRRDSRRHAGDRRADLRPADPPRRARRASAAWPITSTARRSRRGVGPGALRAPQLGRRTRGRRSAPARSAAWPGGCAGLFKEFF